jgi:hypothetical protein
MFLSMADQSHPDCGPTVKQRDTFIIWPLVIPIAAAIAVATCVSFSSALSILALMLGALIIFGWLICMLGAICSAGWRRAWLRLASLLATLVLALPATPISMIAGDYVHFALALPYYAIKIAASTDGSKQIDFHWPSAGFVPSYERNLIYDPSDELAFHVSKVETLGADLSFKRCVKNFLGHFYLVEDYW